MSSEICFVGRECEEEITLLRRREYSTAQGFSLDLGTLGWKVSDDQSYVLAARAGGKVVATMRGEVLSSPSLLEQKLECPWNFPMELAFPVLLLSRAATHQSQRGLGLNLALRYWFLRFALAQGLGALVGTFVAGSPREATLREMGYQFFGNPLGWQQSSYRSHRPVQVVALNCLQNGESAARYAEGKVAATLREFPLAGPFPPLKFVSTL